MAKEKIPLRNVQIKFLKSTQGIKIMVICFIIVCTISMITLRLSQRRLEAETAEMEQQAAQLIVENEKLQDKIDDVGSIQSVQQIAQEELDMVFPDTEFFEPAKE
jgi:cell division protein FtsL